MLHTQFSQQTQLCGAALSLAATGPETGYRRLIGTKTSLKVYLSRLQAANQLPVYLTLAADHTISLRFPELSCT